MDIEERIARRQRTDAEPRLLLDHDALNPVAHAEEPTGRGSAIERLLDALEPAFDGLLPENLYVWGPKGSGKSIVVSALFDRLGRMLGLSDQPIYTTTRAQSISGVEFVYVDARSAKTGFALFHAILDGLVDESIPKQGVGTDAVKDRLRDRLEEPGRRVVVAVDHVREPETHSIDAIRERFDPFADSLAWVLVGRDDPETVGLADDADVGTLEFEPYRRHALVELLTSRVSDGLTRTAITHEQIRAVADWAEGDAHDALAAIFGASVTAERSRNERVEDADLRAGMEAVPRPCASLGRVLSLPKSRQRVLRRLVELDADRRSSVKEAADSIAGDEVGLSRATIERVLYELSEAGITRRVKSERESTVGRPPSRLEPSFPTLAFRHLVDAP